MVTLYSEGGGVVERDAAERRRAVTAWLFAPHLQLAAYERLATNLH